MAGINRLLESSTELPPDVATLISLSSAGRVHGWSLTAQEVQAAFHALGAGQKTISRDLEGLVVATKPPRACGLLVPARP
jgi:hypothetical protein